MSIALGIYVKKYEATTLFLSITKFKLQKGILFKVHNRFWYSIHIRGFCDWFQTKCTWSHYKLLFEKSVVFRQKEEAVVKFLIPCTPWGNVNMATIIQFSLSSFSRLCRQTSWCQKIIYSLNSEIYLQILNLWIIVE